MRHHDVPIALRAALAVAMAVTVAGCGDVDTRCRATQRLSLPVDQEELAFLEGIKESVSRDGQIARTLWLLDADEATGTVTLGLNERSAELCDALHQRYGPLLDIIGPSDVEDGGLY